MDRLFPVKLKVEAYFMEEYGKMKKMLNAGSAYYGLCVSGIACGIYDKIRFTPYPFPWNRCFDGYGKVKIHLSDLLNCVDNFQDVRSLTRGVNEYLLATAIIMCRMEKDKTPIKIEVLN